VTHNVGQTAERRLEADLAQTPWKATTYVAPHEYVMEHWSAELADLIARVRALIKEDGYSRTFRGREFPTVHIGEHYYWTMRLDYPEDGSAGPICLNRAKLPVAV
jgi:hypothetical protein